MRNRRRTEAISGDVHTSSEDLIRRAAEKLLRIESVDEIHAVKEDLDRVLQREAEGINVLTFPRQS